jgi:serine protease Do
MQEIVMLDSIERYIRGEMLPEERVFFEQLRKTNPDVDQMVVEHTVFLDQMNKYGDRKNLKSAMHHIHDELFEAGAIRQEAVPKVIRLWKKYRKVVAVAASIAGITAVSIVVISSYLSPKAEARSIEQLSREVTIQKQTLKSLTDKINEVRPAKGPSDVPAKLGGTGFLIDPKGYIITNAHVVDNARAVTVQNNRGQEFNTKIIYINNSSDLALLKIVDSDFKSLAALPYGISKTSVDLSEQIFTLGYPRDEIVYGEGYMSAKTGFDGDTLTCQIAVAANPGNSGGPVLNKSGEVIGVLSTRQTHTQGAVFAIRSKNIFGALDAMNNDSLRAAIKVPLSSSIKNLDRVQQVKKIQECIYLVKSY